MLDRGLLGEDLRRAPRARAAAPRARRAAAAPARRRSGGWCSGWKVWRPSSRPMGRPVTCGRSGTPAVGGLAREVEEAPPVVGRDVVLHEPVGDGRPVSAASRRIQSSSRSGADRSSPWMPAGASSNTPRPTSGQRAADARTARPRRRTCPGTGSPSMARCSDRARGASRRPRRPRSPPARCAPSRRCRRCVAGSLRAPRSPIT